MKRITLLFLLVTGFHSPGQTLMNLRLRFNDSLVVKKYEPPETDFKFKYVEINPGDYRILNTAIPRILNQETITQVDLVYSDYPEGEGFSELNRKRIIELYMHCPNAFNKQVITWRIVKQTGVRNNADLQKYFHGFVIYFRPLIPFYTEKKYFEDILSQKEQLKDSTVLKVLGHNNSWKDMLCVADVTGSMSTYTVQLLVWTKFNVICGMNKVLNTKYLDIAYATNGSIHTMEEDLVEMGKLNEGKTFKIAGLSFRIVGGRFVQQDG